MGHGTFFIEVIAKVCELMEKEKRVFRVCDVVPSEFFLTLSQDNMDLVRPVQEHFKTELRGALEERLNEINKKKKPHKKNGEWQFHFLPADPNLGSSPVEVACTVPNEAGGGTVGAAPTGTGAAGAPILLVPDPSKTVPVVRVLRAVRRPRLEYTDNSGARIFTGFPNDKSPLSIGRDSAANLRLDAPTDISRIHCMIQKDDDQRFWIWDVSSLGTTVNGTKLPRYTPPQLGMKGPGPARFPLADGARIVLAQNIVIMEFRLA